MTYRRMNWNVSVLMLVLLSLSFTTIDAQHVYSWSASTEDNEVILKGFIPSVATDNSYFFEFGQDSTDLTLTTPEHFFNADSAHVFVIDSLSVSTLEEGNYFYRLVVKADLLTLRGSIKTFEVVTAKAPTVVTGQVNHPASIEQYRTPSITLNGSVNANSSPTVYYFEYGTTTDYGSRSRERKSAPALTSYFTEKWTHQSLGNWYSAGHLQQRNDDMSTDGYIRTTVPESIDWNHIDEGSVGPISLMLFSYTTDRSLEGQTFRFGGNKPDFRDARLSVRLRTHQFDPKGSKLCFWLQSQPYAAEYSLSNVSANWAYNTFSISSNLTEEWATVDLTLVNDASRWKSSGTNFMSHRPWRYAYESLNDALGNLNVDFFFNLLDIDPEDLPTGNIDFEELTIRYRNHSLLTEKNGGSLISWPYDSPYDPAALSDGIKNKTENNWRSADNPNTPQEFVYRFKDPVEVQALQIHQNFHAQAKTIQVLSSSDGVQFTAIDILTIPQPIHEYDNRAFVYKSYTVPIPAKYLKFRITEGYSNNGWGLGEIEVFGNGAQYNPDDEISGVNIDVSDLTIGQLYHYRLVAENAFGINYGEDKTFIIEDNPIDFSTGDTLEINNLFDYYQFYATWQNYDETSERIRYKTITQPVWLKLNGDNGEMSINVADFNFKDTTVQVMAFDPKGRKTTKEFYLKNNFHLLDKREYYVYQDAVIGLVSEMFPYGFWTGNGITENGTFYPNTLEPGELKLLYSVLLGGEILSEEVIVHIKTRPVIVVESGEFCTGDSLKLSTSYHGDNYLWSTGDTLSQIHASASGEYFVDIDDPLYGPLRLAPVTLTFLERPETPVIKFIEPDSLRATGSSGKYEWVFANTIPIPAGTEQIGIMLKGNYQVRAQGDNGCYSSLSENFIVDSLPAKSYYVYENAVLELSANAYPTGVWQGNGTPQQNSFYPDTKDAGEFHITFSVSTQNGIVTNEIRVVVKEIPSITVEGQKFCSGDSVKLSVPDNFQQYIWSTGETTSAIYVKETGEYSLLVMDSLNREILLDPISMTFLEQPPIPSIEFIYPDTLVSSVPCVACEWTHVDKGVLAIHSRKIKVEETGYYTLRIKGENGCYSFSSESQVVDINEPVPYIYPNPSRGIFNITIPETNNLISLKIFDRLGATLFSTKFAAGQKTELFNFQEWPDGTYIVSILTSTGRIQRKLIIVH